MDSFVKVLNWIGTGCGCYVFYKMIKIILSKNNK